MVMAQTAAPAPTKAPANKAPAKKSANPAAAAAADDAEAPAAAKPKRDPAAAQRAIDAGVQHYQSGKFEPAVQSLSAGLAGGNLPPAVMGRALYFRGLAYRKVNKPAQAISDLTSALWLKGGLSETDRADALQQRAAAYRDAGLPDQTDDNGKVAGAARTKTATAAAAPPPQPAPEQKQTPSGGGFFAGLFGGGSTNAAPAPVAAIAPQSAPAAPVAPFATRTRVASAPENDAALAPAAPPPAARAQPAQPQAASPPATAAARLADGKYGARVALAKSKQEAEAIAKRVRTEFAAAIGPRAATIGETTFGAMGTYFQVRVGPYASMAEAADTCRQIKGPGLDCIAVDR
jgi:hypothetical protein